MQITSSFLWREPAGRALKMNLPFQKTLFFIHFCSRRFVSARHAQGHCKLRSRRRVISWHLSQEMNAVERILHQRVIITLTLTALIHLYIYKYTYTHTHTHTQTCFSLCFKIFTWHKFHANDEWVLNMEQDVSSESRIKKFPRVLSSGTKTLGLNSSCLSGEAAR